MIIDEGSTEPRLEDGNGNDTHAEDDDQMSYRMVMRKYYCHLCQKEYSEMVPALQNIKCSGCGEEFVEIIEKKQKVSAAAGGNVGDEVDEEKRKANE